MFIPVFDALPKVKENTFSDFAPSELLQSKSDLNFHQGISRHSTTDAKKVA